MPGSQDAIIRCKGLKTAPNEFSLEDGAQRFFTNMMLTHVDRSASRRGIDRLAAIGGFITRLIDYDGKLLVHFANTSLSRMELDGTGVTSIGTLNTPSNAPAGRIRTAEANKNLYLTSNSDLQRLSTSTGSLERAGGRFAPGFDRHGPATLLTGTGGFLADGKQVAYRYTICKYDANNNFIEGPVSGRYIVSNDAITSGYAAGVAKNTINRPLLPSDATIENFIRVYRSAEVDVGTQPSDDMQLVYERYLTALDLSNKYLEFTDIVPDALRGAFLHTNPNQEGILQDNLLPPFCEEIVAWKHRLWAGGAISPAEYNLRILSVGGSAGIQAADTIIIAGTTYTAVAGAPATASEYHIETAGTVAQNIEATAMNLVSAINKTTGNTTVYAYYVSPPDGAPGAILIMGRSPAAGGFTVQVGNGSQRNCFQPKLAVATSTFDLTRTGGTTVTATKTSGNHTLEVGEQVSISPGSGNFGTGPFTILTVGANTFTYSEAGSNVTLTGQSVSLYGTNSTASNTPGKQNRVRWSAEGMPDAWPIDNWLDVGSEKRRILAMAAIDKELYVWKELEGIFKIIGNSDGTFDVDEVNLKYKPCAAETVVAFDGKVYGLCDKGIVAVNESGLEVVSNDIQEELIQAIQAGTIASPGTADGVVSTMAWALPYEGESFITFFMPGDRDSTGRAGACLYGYTFHSRTRTWSKWVWLNNTSEGKTCGLVHRDNKKMYVADRYGGPSGDSYVFIERKGYTGTDFQDDDHAGTPNPIARTMAWSVQYGKAPTLEKRWDEFAVLFIDSEPTNFTITFRTNAYAAVGASQNVVMGNGNLIARVWPPLEASRRQRLYIELTHAVQSEGFSVAGLGLKYEVLDGKTTR